MFMSHMQLSGRTSLYSFMSWAAFTPLRTLKLMSTLTSVKESVSLMMGTWEDRRGGRSEDTPTHSPANRMRTKIHNHLGEIRKTSLVENIQDHFPDGRTKAKQQRAFSQGVISNWLIAVTNLLRSFF